MGRAVADVIAARSDLLLADAAHRAGPAPALERCDVVIDFSTPPAAAALAVRAAALGGPGLVIGVTGLDPEQNAAIEAAAQRIAVVRSGNFSVGVNILAGLIEQTARRLAAIDWDIEIVEAHHRRKLDAPSGAALMLAGAAARGRNRAVADVLAIGGVGGPRMVGSVGVASVRGGGIVGEHSVIFAAEDERLTLSHSAGDRRLFARGALAAAIWAVEQPPGLYDMVDVLGLRM